MNLRSSFSNFLSLGSKIFGHFLCTPLTISSIFSSLIECILNRTYASYSCSELTICVSIFFPLSLTYTSSVIWLDIHGAFHLSSLVYFSYVFSQLIHSISASIERVFNLIELISIKFQKQFPFNQAERIGWIGTKKISLFCFFFFFVVLIMRGKLIKKYFHQS